MIFISVTAAPLENFHQFSNSFNDLEEGREQCMKTGAREREEGERGLMEREKVVLK